MIVSLLLIGWALAGDPADKSADLSALRTEVRKLVRQFDAPKLADREAAERRLLQMGPRILDLLPPVTPTSSAEIRQRVARVRQALEQDTAQSTAKASTITLEAPAMQLTDVLAALAKQSGNRIIDRSRPGDAAGGPPLSVHFAKTPFWQALDSVVDQAGLGLYTFGGERAIQIVARKPDQAPRTGRACYSGPFRVEATRIVANRDLGRQAASSLVLTIEAAWEPRLRLIGLVQPMSELRVVDSLGKARPAEDPQAAIEALVRSNSMAASFDLPLPAPAAGVKTIGHVKGALKAVLPGKIETFRFPNLLAAKSVEQRIAGATVALEQVRENNGLWEVRLRVRFDDAGNALESHRPWILQNEAFLEDPEGKPIAFDSTDITRRSENDIGLVYTFRLDAPPAKLTFVYKTPGAIITANFPYDLENIPLP